MSPTPTTTVAAPAATARQPPTPTTTTSHDHDRDPVSATTAKAAGSRARHVDDPDIDAVLDALVDAAPPLPYQTRARIAFLLGGHSNDRPSQPGRAA